MPVFVDHEARRRQVVEVASRLIAQAGLDAVTVRDIAVAAECSTAIVSHYFHNKRELLILTYNSSIERGTERCERALAAADGDLKAYLGELMPLDEGRVVEWKIWLAFWARAVSDPEIAGMQRNCILRTRSNIARIMSRLMERGAMLPDLDPEREARQILTALIGMAVQVLFDPDDWPAGRQHGLIDDALRRLYPAGRAPPSISPERRVGSAARIGPE